ncbi:DUF4328 domain-containing protein [Streptomyces sp. NPDC049954]|uniref:DUF4328 domain-containing protein n=1 Tax=Streptomyces sp. NPDC049954 TaxID=3155779 RepID=UPI003431CB68
MTLTGSRTPPPGSARALPALRPHAWTAAGALGLLVLARLAMVVWQFRLHDETAAYIPKSEREEGYHPPLTSLEQTYHWLDDAYTVTLLLSVLAFLLWLRRARDNADVLAPGAQRYRRMWLLLGWFVPVVALWFPRGIVVDVWRAGARGGLAPEERRTPWYVNVWWLLWLWSTVASGTGLAQDDTEAVDQVHTAFGSALLNDVVIIVAAGFAALVVLALSRDQDEVTAPGRRGVPGGTEGD